MPFKPHPTDPDKMVYVKREYNLPKEWVGLTDKEIKHIDEMTLDKEDAIRLTAVALQEKNT